MVERATSMGGHLSALAAWMRLTDTSKDTSLGGGMADVSPMCRMSQLSSNQKLALAHRQIVHLLFLSRYSIAVLTVSTVTTVLHGSKITYSQIRETKSQ